MVKAVLYKEYTTLFHITLKRCALLLPPPSFCKSHTLFHITLKPQMDIGDQK